MLDRVLDFVYPRTCEICGRAADRPRSYLCSDCVNRLPFVPPQGCCRRCGRDACESLVEFVCEDCRTYRPRFDRAASAFRMEGEARELLNAFKFRGHYWLRDDLAEFLCAAVESHFEAAAVELVTWVPSTLGHYYDRGFTPSRDLAKAVARRLGKPAPPFVLRRQNAPRRQGTLSEEERRVNVVGTVGVRRPELVAGRTVLVVDDVMTTGSTLSECADVLKRAKAKAVWCVSVVRSLHT